MNARVQLAPSSAATANIADQRRLTVTHRDKVANGVVRLSLGDDENWRLPPWMPGAHIDVHAPNGAIRQYSLCGDPDIVDQWQIAVLRAPQALSTSGWIHDEVLEGDKLRVSGPRNHFRLVDSPSYLFIAGGIGITPILPMIVMVERAGRPWRLAYAGRTRASMAFVAQLKHCGDRVALYPSREGARLNVEAALAEAEPTAAIFCCGPPSMTEAVTMACSTNEGRVLRVERFEPLIDHESAARGAAFTVELARSGRQLHVADGQTIVEAMELAGLSPSCSCREGVCGTCETRVLAGAPDHRDSVIQPEERTHAQTMMICVSRAKTSTLVLDA